MSITVKTKLLTFSKLKATGLIPWVHWRTMKLKIDHENFPVSIISGRYYFDLKQVELWLKQREQRVAS